MSIEYTEPLSRTHAVLDGNTVLTLTALGERELRETGTILETALLEALILIDGQTSVSEFLLQSSHSAPSGLLTILAEAIHRNLAVPLLHSDDNTVDPGDFFSRNSQHAEPAAPIAHNLKNANRKAQILRRQGYCVNLARRPHWQHPPLKVASFPCFVIDDDPDVCNLLHLYMTLEKFETRSAKPEEDSSRFIHPPIARPRLA